MSPPLNDQMRALVEGLIAESSRLNAEADESIRRAGDEHLRIARGEKPSLDFLENKKKTKETDDDVQQEDKAENPSG